MTTKDPTVSAAELFKYANHCTANADNAARAKKYDHALQWRFAGMVLRLIGDNATLLPDDERRQSWNTTFGYLRERAERIK